MNFNVSKLKMNINTQRQALLKTIPSVDHILNLAKTESYLQDIPRSVLVHSIRSVLENYRSFILEYKNDAKNLSDDAILNKTKRRVKNAMTLNLKHVINATGVIIHTNLGRSLLPDDAIKNIALIANGYSNLEFDLSAGKRGSRYSVVENILCELSGAESAMVVNNNAAAVLLCLETMALGKEVVVSRGELVEIGGSFRIPDVMARSGAILKEVGTTNCTHLKDYENAINDNTGLLLKVHQSNYSIVGFTADVSLKTLNSLGKKRQVPVMEDLGSGTFIDFSKYGMLKEPTIQESVEAGADIVTFSGDKLLGGPQAGIILGRKNILNKIKQNPLTRAVRIDKLTLAALESVLSLYRNHETALKSIPTLRMLTLPLECIENKAQRLKNMLENCASIQPPRQAMPATPPFLRRGINFENLRISIQIFELDSCAGGGSLPLLKLPSKCVGVKIDGLSPNAIASYMRNNTPPIIARIENDWFMMDVRTIQDDEFSSIQSSFALMLTKD